MVAVSKTQPAEAIRAAYEAGARHFGENRVQEWEEKRGRLADIHADWRLIGHLQSNKARRAARLFRAVDSVDGIALARKLEAARAEWAGEEPGGAACEPLEVLIEVRLSAEETKTGVSEGDLPELVESTAALTHLKLRGLMTIPPFFEDAEEARPFFRRLRALRDSLEARTGIDLQELSMGMSHDYEAAIEEGATQVRIGTAIFGLRGGK